ncbi:MAG TPA: biopolymer transporter ExbD [Flavobacteriales bacterium]|nr:biopolymer transporter ExbD [Flavobacteriales bacterium]
MAIRRTHRADPGFSLSSMTDLVFLLLIFFVIVSTMVSPFALPVELPKGRPTTSKEPPKVAVRLEAEGVASLNGKPVPAGGLEAALTAEMATVGANNAVILQVAQDVPTGEMVGVMDMAKRNKWRIVLAAAPKPIDEPAPPQP